MADRPDLSGPIGEVLERVKREMQRTMPTAYSGRPISQAVVALDTADGTVSFTWPDGAKAVADGQVIGVYFPTRDKPNVVTWQWAWGNTNFRRELLTHVLAVRDWGERNRAEDTSIPALECSLERCWAYGMLAATLAGAPSVAATLRNGAMVMMTVGPMRAA